MSEKNGSEGWVKRIGERVRRMRRMSEEDG
jgi:hypothetical protein